MVAISNTKAIHVYTTATMNIWERETTVDKSIDAIYTRCNTQEIPKDCLWISLGNLE